MDVDGGLTICLLSDELLQNIFGYLGPLLVCDLMKKIEQKWWYCKLYKLVYACSFVDYGRVSIRYDVSARVLQIQMERSLSTKRNSCGYSVGDHVRINSDNENAYWSHRYCASRYVKKTGYVVGTTEQFVYVAVGNLWGSDVNILMKKNWNVSRVVIQ
jgi:ribosomal protein L21E